MSQVIQKNIERLDNVYKCKDCKAVLLFKSDVQDHKLMFNHNKFYDMPLE